MYSLRRRLLVTATLLLLLFLGGMTYALNKAFEDSVHSNAEDNLRNQILLLIANIDVIDGELFVPPALPEPRLGKIDSSLFAQISSNAADKGKKPSKLLWRSPSLLDLELPSTNSSVGVFEFVDDFNWPGQPASFVTSLTLEWETATGMLPLTIVVAEHSFNYTKRLRRYQRQVVLGLLILGGLLIALLLALLGWALSPLRRVTKQVGQIEAGERQRFDEDYPLEVSGLTQNLNQLLNFDEQRIVRQKEVLGNLAHSLKTPIAILHGLPYSEQVSADAHQQLSSMQAIIDYQLQSASTVGRRRFAKPIEIKAMSEQIVSSLQKLHIDRGIDCVVDIPNDTVFYGDQGDWMELCGNLLDNAFKWTSNWVRLSVENFEHLGSSSMASSHRKALKLIVEDNGLGIDDGLKATILQRGKRLDSQTPGHGLGLHIVKGIIEAYEGELTISDVGFDLKASSDSQTGTRFKVVLQ